MVTPGGGPESAHDVLARVNALAGAIRSRASQSERLRRMHPDNLRDLTAAGVFRLAMPAAVGGYQADEQIIAEVLAQIARGCPSTGWMCTIMLIANTLPAALPDEGSAGIYATPDLRMTAAIAPTGKAVPVDGGYRVTGRWSWNTAGVHGNWFAGGCVVPGQDDGGMHIVLMRSHEVRQRDTWMAMGMAATATNTVVADDVFVPAARTVMLADLAEGRYPARRHSATPYFNRPWLLFMNSLSAPAIVGIGRGAMDCFLRTLPGRGAITSTTWSRAAEAPVLHHQLASAQYDLEAAEMYMTRLIDLCRNASNGPVTMLERVQARAYIGHIASLVRSCVTSLFDAGGSSEALLSNELQRYLRDIQVLHQHANIQPTTGDETYGRVLAGLAPHTSAL